MKKIIFLLLIAVCIQQITAQNLLLQTLKSEANRNLAELKKQPIPAYYISSFKRILGASDKEQIDSYGLIQTTIISPNALLFEEMDVTRMQNIEFKKPYLVARPD